jgi:uncharacterized protein
MKALIASDIHGRLHRTEKLEHAIIAHRPDAILLLGDFLYNGPRNGVPDDYDPMGVCEILNRYAAKIFAVKGNCDSRIDEELLKFQLKDSRIIYVNGYRCNLIHGDQFSSDLVDAHRGDILMFGHTHIYMLKKEEGLIYLNPGSISFPKNGNPPTYALFDGKTISIRDVSNDEVAASLVLS